ncbi:MAG: sodium:calcium antiporter [Bacteroidetes bacterium]|nr:MAG: sodium:calcium antiporter [Bacteroidota bacterium]
MIQVYLLLIAGLALLFASGKFLVDSSVALARLLKIPTMIVGLTVVAFGTSAPELLVSLQAAFNGYPEMAIGNVVGSNISNILLVLAITALVYPIPVPASSLRRDWPMMAGISLLLFLMAYDLRLSRSEGLILVLLLLLYIGFAVWMGRREKRGNEAIASDGKGGASMAWWVALLLLLASVGGLALGADLLVNNAALIAEEFGVSKRIISISMVAVGTSIPELTTSVIAALKKESDLSVGNIIGSNIMNILSVLGLTSVIAPIRVEREIACFDIPAMLITGFLLLPLMLPAARARITRFEGLFMILLYLLYIYLIF